MSAWKGVTIGEICDTISDTYRKQDDDMSEHIYSQEELSCIVSALLKRYHAQRAILFGSYARQEADKGSDIDLIVIGGKDFDPTDVFALADDLHRTTGKDVDVYEISEINAGTDFYNAILSEGVQIA